ncbi:tetratricopeptide repeat-containing diguanylate cyclase [Shewanella psychrotolerans]|uniref:tetratricopeptide repeat-containing diguanylate cyclase n=1 Tax=Shewanella psychrotolerans TaxID=2864206 RepID=UPI0021AC6656|nr:GGDEF domain-containing protein [Shewanella psychrotolerans]
MIILTSWTRLSLLASIGMLLVGLSFPVQSAPFQPKSVEKALEVFDSGELTDSETIKVTLNYLKKNISVEDTKNYLKLQAVICWNGFDLTDNKAIEAAIEFVNLKLASKQIAKSSETATDLKLCRAYMYQLIGKVDLALQEYNDLVHQAYLIDSPKLIADSRSLRGAMYSFQGNFAGALEDFIIAQHLYESLNLKAWAQYNLIELATSYRRFGDPQTAIKYYQQLEVQFSKQGDNDTANLMKTEIAYALEELGENSAALEKHLQSYHYWKDKSDDKSSAFQAINIAGILIKLDRVEEAEKYLSQATEFIKVSDGASYSFMRLFQAQAALHHHEMEKAHAYLNEAETAFTKIKNSRGLEQLYLVQSQAFISQQNWQQAVIALQDYIATHQALDATRQTNSTTEMRTRFNTEKVERENKQLLKIQKIKENELIILNQNKYLQLAVIILSGIIMVILSVISYKQSKKSKQLSVLASTDHLTQLPNRRSTYLKGETYFKSKESTEHPLSLILFDADNFKQINDQLGHDIGDKVLISLANISNMLMRKQDLVGRVGGEEFLIVLPNTSSEQAFNIAQRLVATVEKSNFDDIPSDLKLTISAGIATQADENSFDMLLKRADKALYSAKAAGRNCAVLSDKNSA